MMRDVKALVFEFADAEVADCRLQGDVLSLRFAAARVHSGPRGEEQWMAVQLLAAGVQPASAANTANTANAAACLGRLHGGLLCWADDGSRQRQLPLPFHSARPCMLELEFAQGERCLWAARSVQLLPGRCAVDAYQC